MNQPLEDKSHHIESQLSRMHPKMVTANSTKVCCPFHNDDTPSLRIWHRSGKAQCYGCGWKGEYDDVALARGLEPYKRDPMRPITAAVVRRAEEEKPDNFDRALLDDYKIRPLPLGKTWRKVPTYLLSDVGCKLMTHKDYGTRFILMPVYINGELRGFSRARMKKEEGKPSYISAGGQWIHSAGLWPFDYAIKLMRRIGSSTIVVVEGQRDALRLLANGIPAVCFFGTNGWTDQKAQLLEAFGVSTVVIMPDGDQAGIDCLDDIVDSVNKFLTAKPVRLWNIKGNPWPKYKAAKTDKERAEIKKTLWDPGSMPQRIVDQVKRTFFQMR